MIYTVTSPVGIDVPIKNLQNFLYRALRSAWSLTEDQVRAYPRGRRLDGQIRFFTSSDYLDSDGLMDTAYAVQFFFLESERRDFANEHFSAPVDIYFFVNLQTVKPALTTLADEEVKQDVFSVVRQGSGNFHGFDKVELEGFNEKMNMYPYHSFKVSTNLIYRYDKTI